MCGGLQSVAGKPPAAVAAAAAGDDTSASANASASAAAASTAAQPQSAAATRLRNCEQERHFAEHTEDKHITVSCLQLLIVESTVQR